MSYQFKQDLNLPFASPKKNITRDSLDSLENDETYIETAQRFLSSIGENDQQVEDVYEYLRDEEWNLGSAAKRSLIDMPSWSKQQKDDYVYLQQKYKNADMGGISQYLSFAGDISLDLASDPLTLASVIAAPFTGGTSLTGLLANKGLAQTVKMGLKKVGKNFKVDKGTVYVADDAGFKILKPTGEIDWKATMAKGKVLRQQAVKDYYKDKVKTTAILGAGEGVVWAGLDSYFRQQRESIDGINLRDGFNAFELGKDVAMGGIFGGVLGGGISKLGTTFSSSARYNLTKFSDEVSIDQNSLGFKASKLKDTIISKTIGKPVTRFLTIAEKSPLFKNLLEEFRYDTYKFSKERGAARIGVSYNEELNNLNGKYHQKYEDVIRPLLTKGKLASEDELILSQLMRIKDKNEYRNVIGATATHIQAADKISLLSKEVLEEGARYGVYRTPLRAGPNSWFPRRWLWDEVQENRNELADIMVKSEAVSLDDITIISLLTNENDKRSFIEMSNLTNAYEELLTNLPSKKPEDLENFIRDIGKKYNVSSVVDGMMFESKAMSYELGKLTHLNNLEKKKIELSLPMTPEVRGEKLSVANSIIDDMLSKKNQVNSLDIETLGTVMPSSFSPRKLLQLDDLEIDKFISSDFDSLMRDYFNQSARLYTRTKKFGANLKDFNDIRIKPIEAQLKKIGVTLTNNDKEELANLYNFTTGLDSQGYGLQGLNTIGDTIKVSQQLAHLPLVTLSSLTEIFVPLTRVGIGGWAKGMADTIKLTVQKTSDDTLSELQNRHKLSKDESLREMHRVFLGINQAVAQRINGLAGEGVHSVTGRKIQDKFFKYNLLEDWTRTVQLASFTMGKDLITRNLKRITDLEDVGRTLSKGEQKTINRLGQELLDLGIDISRGKQWVRSGAKRFQRTKDPEKLRANPNIDIDKVTDLNKWDAFYEYEVMQGAARFTNEVILDPSKASSIRPHAQQTPTGTILFQFLGYPTAFSNTVLKNYYGQAVRDPIRGGAKVLSTGLIMTAGAAGTNWIRNGGNFNNYKGEEQSSEEIAFEAVQRWGGLGYADYIDRAVENAEIGGGLLGSTAKAVTGPIVGDAVDMLLYRKGIGEVAASNVPFYSAMRALPSVGENRNFKKDVQGLGQDIDRALGLRPEKKVTSVNALFNRNAATFKSPSYDRGFVEGGKVNEEIPQASVNPSNRIDSLTGMSYADQAGDILNNRLTFARGGKLSNFLIDVVQSANTRFLQDDTPLNVSRQDPDNFLDNYISNDLIDPVSVNEQQNRLNMFIQESKVSDDVYFIDNVNGNPLVQTNPTYDTLYTGSSLKAKERRETNNLDADTGKVRILNPFEYDSSLDSFKNNPSALLKDEEFLSFVSKKDKNLAEELKRLQTFNTKFEEGSMSLSQEKFNYFLNSKVLQAFRNNNYDAISGKEKSIDILEERSTGFSTGFPLRPNVALSRDIKQATQPIPQVRTAGESVGATVTTLLKEADEQAPGFRDEFERSGMTGILDVDQVPKENLIDIDAPVTTYSPITFFGNNETGGINDFLSSDLQKENNSYLLLNQKQFLPTNKIFNISKDTYLQFNTQNSEVSRAAFIDQYKIKLNTNESEMKQEILKGNYHLITSLLPSTNTKAQQLKEELPAIPTVYEVIPETKKAFAYYSKTRKEVVIDRERTRKAYEEKAWTRIRKDVQEKKPGVLPLPENTFKTFEEWENFIIRHEYSHGKYLIEKGETKGEYENRMNRIALGIMDYLPSKILTLEQATKESLENIKNQINLNDEGQKNLFDSFVEQLAKQEEDIRNRETAPPLFFISEYIQGQPSKFLNDDENILLNINQIVAFVKGRQALKPAEFLHHPSNNDVNNPIAKAFSSVAPPLTSVEQAEKAAIDYMRKVEITEPEPYLASRFDKFETKDTIDSARLPEDESEGIYGFQTTEELEDINKRFDPIFKDRRGNVVKATNEGKFLVQKIGTDDPDGTYTDNDLIDKNYEYILKDSNKAPTVDNRIVYEEPLRKKRRKTVVKPKKKIAAKAKFKQTQPTQPTPAITKELPMLRRMSEASESLKTLPAFKETDPVQQKRILNLIDKYQKPGKQ